MVGGEMLWREGLRSGYVNEDKEKKKKIKVRDWRLSG